MIILKVALSWELVLMLCLIWLPKSTSRPEGPCAAQLTSIGNKELIALKSMAGQGDGRRTFRLHGQGTKGERDKNRRIALTWRGIKFKSCRRKIIQQCRWKGKGP